MPLNKKPPTKLFKKYKKKNEDSQYIWSKAFKICMKVKEGNTSLKFVKKHFTTLRYSGSYKETPMNKFENL